VKLPLRVILAVRDAVGSDFPIGVRINGEEFTKEGNTLLQSTRVARRFVTTGIDYISVSAGERFEDAEPPPPGFAGFPGTGYSGYRMSPRWWHPDGVQVYLAESIRKAVREAGVNIPVVTAGKIRTPELAEEILEQGRADIIGMTRALLADPDWPIKAREDRSNEIVKCAACGFCSEADERYRKVTCIAWPKDTLHAPSPWRLMPPCQAACPVRLNIRGYMEAIVDGQYERGFRLIADRIPFPATISRICPRPCEEKCNRGNMDDPIAINALKRFVADFRGAGNARREVAPAAITKPERIAIIGSGPAGLTAAFDLVMVGYGVTVFEALSVPGGMMAAGIPEYRLPREILWAEIETIRRSGVEIRLNSPIGGDGIPLDDLWAQGYRAIFIAVGAHRGLTLGLPNEDIEGIVDGAVWLRNVNFGGKGEVGKRVVVVGGGSVAVDSARVALRLGAKHVSIIYRRTQEDMPATRDDIREALKEGVKIRCLSSPCRIIGQDGRCVGLECSETTLGEPDERGRKRPIQLAGSEFVVDADMVISAVGQIPDLSFLNMARLEAASGGTLRVDRQTLATRVDGIFAGGDAVSGPSTAIEAIAAGKRGAMSIDRYLRRQRPDGQAPPPYTIALEDVDTGQFKKRKRQKMPVLPPKRRIGGSKEVEIGFSELAAHGEADRCLQCGLFPRRESTD
jgi:NADPH-dependent glutamate synthase beta subunit-like oxidoreductase